MVVACREYINCPILISVTALKLFTNRRWCLLELRESGCEKFRLADIARIASRIDNFVNNPLSEFLQNRGLERWQCWLSFLVAKTTERAAIFLSLADTWSDIWPRFWVTDKIRAGRVSPWFCNVVSGCGAASFDNIFPNVFLIMGVEGWRILLGLKACAKFIYSTVKNLKMVKFDVVWWIRWIAHSTKFRLYFVGTQA